MAKYVGRSKQRFYAKKTAGKDYGKLFSCHCSMWHIVVLWQAAKRDGKHRFIRWRMTMYCRIRAFMIRRSKKEVRADYEQFLQEVISGKCDQ